jgi:glycosyltransferase involved in cell wall biosynthesis
MGAARPMVLSVDGEARRVVEQAQAGVFVPPEDPVALSEAILKLMNSPSACTDMGERGRAFVEASFSRKALARQYLDVLEELLVARA